MMSILDLVQVWISLKVNSPSPEERVIYRPERSAVYLLTWNWLSVPIVVLDLLSYSTIKALKPFFYHTIHGAVALC